ncbi:TPA: glycosyltransferase [Aeromonas salmonicida]|nr:glycosyltransferase [Aeromonas salmonicida]
MNNLKLVHKLISEKKTLEAIEILDELSRIHPNFSLYKIKLNELKNKTKDNHIVPPASKNTVVISKPAESASLAEKIAHGALLGTRGEIATARTWLSNLLRDNKNNVQILIELARLDLADERFSDALHKAKIAINIDKNQGAPFKIAEQAAIELGNFKEANQFFLEHPKHKNPDSPRKRGKNSTLPDNFVMPPLVGAGNDYRHILQKANIFTESRCKYHKKVSIIIPVYNRYQILANTLAALTHQSYPKELMEVIVVDDGSNDKIFDIIRKYEHHLNLYYGRQKDAGFRVSAARNIGLKIASNEAIILLDADILPCPNDVEEYMKVLHVADDVVLIGHRRYVDVSRINDDAILENVEVATKLPDINPDNDVADYRLKSGESIDWRFPVYEKTDYLINDPWPFTKGAGGNLAFSKTTLEMAGLFDEEFTAWGCEDTEFSYRLYNVGAYFIPMLNIVSLHQEPVEKTIKKRGELGESFRAEGHKQTRMLMGQKCPAPVIRNYSEHRELKIPKVSIYIPAFNAAEYIIDAVNSCLEQNYDDLEICICNDGSTDNTLDLLEQNFSGNHKVRWVTQINSGIGKSTNTAIGMCRGLYIGQLDADDRLKQNAIRQCVQVLDSSAVDAVYTDCDLIDGNGDYIRDGWCGGEFARDWMATGMIATHFRMFRKRLWHRTIGCNEQIKNAVDLDLWLKLNERGAIHHIHEVLYSYRWHGTNTSIRDRKLQEKNHLRVVNDSLKRQQLDLFWQVQSTNNKLNPREFKIVAIEHAKQVKPQDVIILIPTCIKYADKADAIRKTWKIKAEAAGFRCYYLAGNPELNQTVMYRDTIYVPCKDDYESLVLKLCLGYEFLYKAVENFTHVYKIDDDCYLDVDVLIRDILPQLAGKQYVGGATHPKGASMNNKWHFGKCSNQKFDVPYKYERAPYEFAKGGYGYFMRKDILPVIFQHIDECRQELINCLYAPEDVRFSELLGRRNIIVSKISGYTFCKSAEALDKKPLVVFDIQYAKEIKFLKNIY